MTSHIDKYGTAVERATRMALSQHVDNDPAIGQLISDNRNRFAAFVQTLAEAYTAAGGNPTNPNIIHAIEYAEQAKLAMSVALVESVGKVEGMDFEEAVKLATAKKQNRS